MPRKLKKKKTRRRRRRLFAHPLSKIPSLYLGGGIILLLLVAITISWHFGSSPKTPQLNYCSRLPKKAWGYFHPRWDEHSFWTLLNTGSNDSNISLSQETTDLHQIVHDQKNRIAPLFKTPRFLETRVLFWVDIYARYDNRIRVIHDRNNLDIVYGHLDFRPLYRVKADPNAIARKRRSVEKEVLTQIRSLLRIAALPPTFVGPLPEDTAPMKKYLVDRGVTKPFPTLIKTIRTQTGQKNSFKAAIDRSRDLLPHIENVFKDQGLPITLSRIPFVESSFNAKARSRLGAVGLWQFTPPTATQMIHPWREELWRDPILQTKAAGRLLKMYREMLPDWPTTITAYNSGVGNLKKLLRKHWWATNYEQLYLSLGNRGLGFAGKNFYSEFLAATLVEAYKEEIFEPAEKLPREDVAISEGFSPFPNEICIVE